MKKSALAMFAGVLAVAGPAVAQNYSTEELDRRAIERRAVEAVNWGMAFVNYDMMLQAMIRDTKGAPNQIVYWSRLPDWKNQTLTPNPEVIYVMPFFDTRDVGPMVLEIPPAGADGSITGTIMDASQAALEDVGPAGVDKGKGGKYLILPPGSKDRTPSGYIVLRSPYYQGYALLRSILKSGSDADVAKASAYAKRIKLYPLSKAANPPPTKFNDAIDVVFDATIPYDLRFFQSLNRMVQVEPWLSRDKAMIDMLKSIGVEKGKSFNPDAKMQASLNAAGREARAWLDARYETSLPAYYEGGHWTLPTPAEFIETMGTSFEKPNGYALDARGLADTYLFSSVKHLGEGQFYLLSDRDRNAQPLDGASNYRITVPANAPVRQFWSVVLYDRETHALIRDLSRPSRSSQSQGLQKNADGSVDVYFGPRAPTDKEANWVPTMPGREFEAIFRFYGPEKPLFDKTWSLPDIEKVK
ncbi:MAG TPA: DUF1254 domain-containing protein [Candidatus Udaeobacter sp.]|jgi:hypothetical protein